MSSPRLGIGIIAAGRVGAVLGAALRAEGHAITGAYAISDASRARAEALLPGVPLSGVPEIVERSEMVLLAVPDDQLPALATGIARTGIAPGGQIFAHTSGRYGIEVLAPLRDTGAMTLALHPAMTFTGTSVDLPRLVGCPVGVTATQQTLPVAQALVIEIGGEPVRIAEADRPVYHAALSHGANHLVVLVDQARELLRGIGVEDRGAYLRPLMHAALEESLRRGASALTGPVARGDAGTVRAHLEALDEVDEAAGASQRVGGAPLHTDVTATYRSLARAALRRSGLPADDAQRVADILDGDRPHDTEGRS